MVPGAAISSYSSCSFRKHLTLGYLLCLFYSCLLSKGQFLTLKVALNM